jgi:acetyl-CoA C-acetyltransferase
VARTADDPDLFAALSGKDMVGRTVRLTHDTITKITAAYL